VIESAKVSEGNLGTGSLIFTWMCIDWKETHIVSNRADTVSGMLCCPFNRKFHM